jgi:HEAT repeat protein
LIDDLVEASQDHDPLIRQLSAFTLGIFDSPVARDRLVVLLDDSDEDTQLNAAIGLARHRDLRCLGTLKRALKPDPAETSTPEQAYERFVAVKNVLKAVEQLAPELGNEDRQQLTALVKALVTSTSDPLLRVSAESALRELESGMPAAATK